jgi:hypothetical protein
MGFNKDKFMEHVTDELIGLFKPMNMVYSYGCLANELSVNGISEIDMTDSQRKLVIHKIMHWYKNNPNELNGLLQYFIETHSDDTDLSDICEQCGDRVITFKKTL